MISRFGLKGRYIVDRMKHRQYPIKGWRTDNSGYSRLYAIVPVRFFMGYPLGNSQTFLLFKGIGRAVI